MMKKALFRYSILMFLVGVIVVLGSQNTKANWKDVRSDANNIHRLVNVTMGSELVFMKDSTAKFNQSLWVGKTNGQVALGNKSYMNFGFTAKFNKTIEFWLFLNKTTAGNDGTKFLYFNDSGGTDLLSFAYTNANSADTDWNNISLKLDTFGNFPNGPNDYYVISHKVMNNSQWHHIALVWYNTTANGSNYKYLRAFVDGTSIFTIANKRSNETRIQFMNIGKTSGSSSKFGIDEIRMSNSSRYLLNFTPPTNRFQNDAQTIALWHLDDAEAYTVGLSRCNAPGTYSRVAINFSFFDEINQTKFNITKWTSTFTSITNNSIKVNNTFTVTNSPRHVSLCISPANKRFITNATIKYEKNGFDYRNYYLYNYNLTSTRQNKSLYLLQDTKDELITILVTDSLDSPLKNVITDIQKYFIANNTWQSIGMIKSGEDGKDAIYLQQNEVDYRFLIYQDGILKKTTTGQKLTAATYTIKLIPSSLGDLISNIGDLITNMTYVNHTKTFKFGYYDPNNKLAGACLQVGISNTTGTYFKPTSCQYGSYRGIISLSPGNSTPSTSTGYGYVVMNGSILNFGKQTLQVVQGLYFHTQTWGKFGLYLLIFVIMVLVTVQISMGSPVGAIVMLMLGLFAAWWMDVFSMTTIVFTSLMIGLGIVIKELRSG